MARPDIHREVVDFLRQYGAIEDPAGRATGKFKAALDFDGSFAAFTQLIAAMEREGTLARSVKGRRTYRIALAHAGEGHPDEMASTSTESNVDYDELAAALLVQVVQSISTNSSDQEPDRAWTQRQIERLEGQNRELKDELFRAKADLKVSLTESESLKVELENCQKNLALLTDKFVTRKPGENAQSRLKADDRALLNHLLATGSKDRSDRAR
jgi:regulator of replication initiation timing